MRSNRSIIVILVATLSILGLLPSRIVLAEQWIPGASVPPGQVPPNAVSSPSIDGPVYVCRYFHPTMSDVLITAGIYKYGNGYTCIVAAGKTSYQNVTGFEWLVGSPGEQFGWADPNSRPTNIVQSSIEMIFTTPICRDSATGFIGTNTMNMGCLILTPKSDPVVALPAANVQVMTRVSGPTGQMPCPAGQTLMNGACITAQTTCPAGTTFNAVTNTCVAAQMACPAGQTMVNGACVTAQMTCPAGQTLMNGTCVTAQTTCPPGTTLNSVTRTCVAAQMPCPTGQTMVNGVCVAAQMTCPAGTTFNAVTNTCVAAQMPCPAGQTMVNGVCGAAQMCSSGATLCAGTCTNLAKDPRNCGACGNVCSRQCQKGKCR